MGAGALLSNTTGPGNTANGAFALFNSTTGSFNTAVGDNALFSNSRGEENTAVGHNALFSNAGPPAIEGTLGSFNCAFGSLALFSNTTGLGSSAFGYSALVANDTGQLNAAIGGRALFSNVSGSFNTATGIDALSNSTGDSNTALGYQAGNNVTTASNVICIGADVGGADVSDSCYIGNIFDATAVLGSAVFVSSDNKLGTITSSKRFKEEISPMDKASEALFSLKPVTFRYKKEVDPAGTSQLGLVAEDVEKVSPALVVRDKEGKPYSIRYNQVNAMLLNEFLKEHRKNEKQEATIARQQRQIEALTAGLQKVNAQLKLSQPAPQTALNNH